MTNPILSICIPTYNRAAHLRTTLMSIVSQAEFCDGNAVEIVISDNCSTDATESVAREFANRYPGKIRYNRNETNIADANFERALSLGCGAFLKLHNDTAVFVAEHPLATMVDVVKKALRENSLPFFLNGCCGARGDVVVESLDDFILETKYYCTWISAFGVWRRDFPVISETLRRTSATKLSQTCALLEHIANGATVLVCKSHLVDVAPVSRKGGYNVAEIFGYRYIALLKTYLNRGCLSKRVYKRAKRDLLSFINRYYFDVGQEFAFDKTGYFRWLLPYYKCDLYFYRKWFRMCCRARWHKIKCSQ